MEKKARKPSNFKPETIVKREFVARTIKNYGHHLLPRETKILNELFISISPDLSFWTSLNLPFQLNSLAYLKTDKGWDLIQSEWKKFNFRPLEKEEFKLEQTNFFKRDNESLEIKIPEKKNLKSVLKLW